MIEMNSMSHFENHITCCICERSLSGLHVVSVQAEEKTTKIYYINWLYIQIGSDLKEKFFRFLAKSEKCCDGFN